MTVYAEKLLPHDVEAEEAVLGSILIDGECLTRLGPAPEAGRLLPGKEPGLLRRRPEPCSSATRPWIR